MSRLVGAKPIIEVDKEVAEHPAGRAVAGRPCRAGAVPARDQFRDGVRPVRPACARV